MTQRLPQLTRADFTLYFRRGLWTDKPHGKDVFAGGRYYFVLESDALTFYSDELVMFDPIEVREALEDALEWVSDYERTFVRRHLDML